MGAFVGALGNHCIGTTHKHAMADNSLEAVDLLCAGFRGRIEVASIEHICKVDIKK